MINADMRLYDYWLIGADNGYGQAQMPDKDAEPQGKVRMSINSISQAVADNVRYKEATYLGLTHNADIDETCIIKYGAERLKVLYINPKGRFKQVFMGVMV